MGISYGYYREPVFPRNGADSDPDLDGMFRLRKQYASPQFLHRLSITYIVPTIGRESLSDTIASIDLWDGDEILVYRRHPPAKTWGYTERNEMMPHARCSWLAFIDDDDRFLPGYRAAFTDAMNTLPGGRPVPVIFRMQFPNGTVLWRKPEVECGNVGTPMYLMPNVPSMLGAFNEQRYVGDFDFLNCSKWPRRNYYWRSEIVVEVGNDLRGGQVMCDV